MSARIIYTPLKRKDLKHFVEGFCSRYPRLCSSIGLGQPGMAYEVSAEGVVVYVVDGVPIAFRYGEEVLPTLVVVRMAGMESTSYVVVDAGAVKPILNGADVMAPGIVEASPFSVGDTVVVWSLDRRTPLAVTKALMGSSEVLAVKRGRALKNLHHAGDDVWGISLEALKKFGKL